MNNKRKDIYINYLLSLPKKDQDKKLGKERAQLLREGKPFPMFSYGNYIMFNDLFSKV